MAYAMQKYLFLIAFGVLSFASFAARADDSDYSKSEDSPYGSLYKNKPCSYYNCEDDKNNDSNRYKNIAPRAGNNDPYQPHEAEAPKGRSAAVMRGLLQD